jgi:hypothetical protein
MPGPRYSNWTLLVRLLSLAKQYRWGCLRLVLLQLVILGMGLTGLAMVGLAVDPSPFTSGDKARRSTGPGALNRRRA